MTRWKVWGVLSCLAWLTLVGFSGLGCSGGTGDDDSEGTTPPDVTATPDGSTPGSSPDPSSPTPTDPPDNIDGDGDGYSGTLDCNDKDKEIHPGATEVCDSVDNDCDSQVDEGLAQVWYADQDEDGYGASSSSLTSCTQPSGYAAQGGDCDDSRDDVNPGALETCNGRDDDCDAQTDEGSTYYFDQDKDGYGTSSSTVTSCSPPVGYVAQGGDCNDLNPAVNPGMTEACDGVDNNCDSQVDNGAKETYYLDTDKDTYGNDSSTISACPMPMGYTTRGGDCNDNDATVNPGATETCDLKDNDCDSQIDESLSNTWYADTDSDGYGNPASTTQSCTQPSGYVANDDDCNDKSAAAKPGATEICDSIDNDCDGSTDEGLGTTQYLDQDHDGYGVSTSSIIACGTTAGYSTVAGDCDDTQSSVHPDATESCDGLDNDCDSLVDEGFSNTLYLDGDRDGYGLESTTRFGCTPITGYSLSRGDCNDSDKNVYPGAADVPGGADSDCGGSTGSDPHVGLSLSSALSLYTALSQATAGMTIWVGPGTYYEYGLTFLGKKISLKAVRPGSQTVIHAQGLGRHFRFNTAETTESVLDGFQLEGGIAAVGQTETAHGGSISVEYSSPTLRNLIFFGNRASGGDGGAIFGKSASPVIQDCVFVENQADDGGALFADQFSGRVEDSEFFANSALESASTAFGGGITLENSSGFMISDSYFFQNYAVTGGGAIDLFKSSGEVKGCTFDENQASYGGAMHLYTATTLITQFIASNNQATGSTGGAFNITTSSAPIFRNGLITGNIAASYGGGMSWYNSSGGSVTNVRAVDNSADEGGGINISGSSISVSYSTIAGNDATVGGGIHVYYSTSIVTLKGLILAYNTGYNLLNDTNSPGSPSITYSDLYTSSGTNNSNVTLDGTNLTISPSFQSWTGDESSNLHLSVASGLINKGVTSDKDADGSTADMGAYGAGYGDEYDLDRDGYNDYFWPGTFDDEPGGINSSLFDCDDLNAARQTCAN